MIDTLTKAHKALLLDLLSAEVEFMLIGGYAVNFHGYPRYTVDLDIWLKPDDDNKRKFASFLKLKGFDTESLARIRSLNFTKTNSFHIGEGENKVDFLTKISGVNYTEADEQKVFLSLSERKIPVIHYHHLIATKMTSDRVKDQADVEELQRINRFREEK